MLTSSFLSFPPQQSSSAAATNTGNITSCASGDLFFFLRKDQPDAAKVWISAGAELLLGDPAQQRDTNAAMKASPAVTLKSRALSNQSALRNVKPGGCWSARTRCHLTGIACHFWPALPPRRSLWCNTADHISASGCRTEGPLRRCPPVWTKAPNLCQRPLCLTVRLTNWWQNSPTSLIKHQALPQSPDRHDRLPCQQSLSTCLGNLEGDYIW